MCISRTTTSKTAATFKPSVHLWRLELRVSPIIRIKPAESLYGGHAIAKAFLEIPRGTPANTKAFPTRLAGLPQTPKYFPRDLREYPQTPKHFPRDLREYPQTPKHFPWDLREYPQTPRQTPRDLRDSRRHQSISKSTLAVTALCPSHSSGIRSLILSFKLTLQRFLEREIRRRGHPFRSDRSFRGYTLLRSISEVPI